jgi:hypothetical protein
MANYSELWTNKCIETKFAVRLEQRVLNSLKFMEDILFSAAEANKRNNWYELFYTSEQNKVTCYMNAKLKT